ncbi:MAG: preprotein translocase subunit SecE [Lactobacillales bacterium]|nr:preprotein translocase subunit SecE [Lactobacillales bacterium]
MKKFFKGVKLEFKKIKWPSKKEMTTYSIATILCVIVFALFFTGLDFLITAVKEVIH